MSEEQIKEFSKIAAQAVADYLMERNGSVYGTDPIIERELKKFVTDNALGKDA